MNKPQVEVETINRRGAAPIQVFADGRRLEVIAGCSDVEFTKAEWRKLVPIIRQWIESRNQ